MLVLDISGCLLSSVLTWNEIWTYLMKLNETRHNYTIQSGNSRYVLTQPWHLPSVPHHFTWTWRKYASTKHATGLVPAVGRSSSICSYKPWFNNIQYVAKRDDFSNRTQQAIDQTRRTTSFTFVYIVFICTWDAGEDCLRCWPCGRRNVSRMHTSSNVLLWYSTTIERTNRGHRCHRLFET